MRCGGIGGLLTRRRSGLSDAEKLRLEDHLTACARCRETAADLATLSALSDEMAATLPSSARERVIARALASGRVVNEPSSTAWAWPAAVAAAAAVVLAIVWTSASPDSASPIAGLGESTPVKRVEPDRVIETQKPTTFRLAQARVRFTEMSRAQWKPRMRTIDLERGAVWAKVDSTPQLSFRVRTRNFVVEVMGTEFWVDPSEVRVFEGRVRVTDNDNRTLTELGENETWELEDRDGSSDPSEEPAAPSKRSLRTSHAATLQKARRALSEGRTERARSLVGRVTRSKRAARYHRAEAAMLLAECAAKDGDRAGSVRLYLEVAERFDGLPAAETALFAAARASQGAQAKRLLERYLETYPQGRFADLARMHLGSR